MNRHYVHDASEDTVEGLTLEFRVAAWTAVEVTALVVTHALL